MKALVEYMIKALVDHPDHVSISAIQGSQNVVIEVRCHPHDMGRVIGKNGKTIGAMRVLLSGMAAKQGRKSMLEVVE
ncbi:MAG: KH domain-containing protein [Lentisphaerae bacterium]|nr:KH domain-containing protein [Lentisphaerota bacterium]